MFVADKGSVLLNGLVDYYLETSSPQAVDLLSSVREPHDKVRKELALCIQTVGNGLLHYFSSQGPAFFITCVFSLKHLLDKMNECMAKPSGRLPTLILLGHVVRKQPPWIHKITRFPLLTSLLRCLKVLREKASEQN